MRGRPLQAVIRHLHRLAAPGEAPATDAQLPERFTGQGDQEAFELLVWRHGRLMLGVCRGALRDVPISPRATFFLGDKECTIDDLKRGMSASLRVTTEDGKSMVIRIRGQVPAKKK